MAKNRKSYPTEFKAQVLAELSQLSPRELAAKHGINVSSIFNWMKAAGMQTSRQVALQANRKAKRAGKKPRQVVPNDRQAAALAAWANRGDKTLNRVAADVGTSPKTIRKLVNYFGDHTPTGAHVTNGLPAAPPLGVLAARNGAAVNPLLAIAEARRVLSGILTQLDAVSSAFEAFQTVFGIHPLPSASVTQ